MRQSHRVFAGPGLDRPELLTPRWTVRDDDDRRGQVPLRCSGAEPRRASKAVVSVVVLARPEDSGPRHQRSALDRAVSRSGVVTQQVTAPVIAVTALAAGRAAMASTLRPIAPQPERCGTRAERILHDH